MDNKKKEEKTLESLWRGLMRADEREQENGSGSAFAAKGDKEKQQQKAVAKNNAHKLKTSKKMNKECYFCGKPGYFKTDYYHYKKNPHKEKKSTKDEAATFVCQAEANFCENLSWISDSGASFHMVYNKNLFCELYENRGGVSIKLSDDKKVISIGIGKVKVDAWRSRR